MNILSIDQSLTETGFWINENINGVIKSNLKEQFQRILNIRNTLLKLIQENNIDTIIIEGYSYGSSNTKFTFTAGELGGMLKLLAFDNKIKLIIIPPTLLKKFICNKGNVKKEQMLLQIYKKYNKEFDNNNIADAFAMYKFYVAFDEWNSGKFNFNKIEIECFKKFNNPFRNVGDM